MPLFNPGQLLSDPEVSPLALVALLTGQYNTGWLSEDPDTVLDDIEEDLGKPHPVVQEKIRALRACNATAAPWSRFEVFAPVAQAFSGTVPVFNRHIILEPSELALAVFCMNRIRTERIEEEIGKYMAATLMQRGIHFIPIPELAAAEPFLTPHNTGAETVFRLIENKPLEDVEVNEESNDGIQAIMGRAELAAFKDILSLWSSHENSAQRFAR